MQPSNIIASLVLLLVTAHSRTMAIPDTEILNHEIARSRVDISAPCVRIPAIKVVTSGQYNIVGDKNVETVVSGSEGILTGSFYQIIHVSKLMEIPRAPKAEPPVIGCGNH